VFPSLGSTGALRALAEGALDVAIVGRPLTPAEAALPWWPGEFARTPFALAVNPRLAVTGLTHDELVRLYRSETPRWPGGDRVRIVLRSASDTDTALLRAISPEMSVAVDAALARPGMLVAITNAECNEMIDRTPGAIGPTTLLQVGAEPHGLRLLAWNGVPPTLEAMRRGAYPLVKHVRVVVRRDPSPRCDACSPSSPRRRRARSWPASGRTPCRSPGGLTPVRPRRITWIISAITALAASAVVVIPVGTYLLFSSATRSAAWRPTRR